MRFLDEQPVYRVANRRINESACLSLASPKAVFRPPKTLRPEWNEPFAVLVEVDQGEGGQQPFVILLQAPGRPEGFHLQPPTDPYVNLSIHTARRSRASASFEIKSSPEVEAHPGIPVGQAFHRAASSPSLTAYYRRFNATTG